MLDLVPPASGGSGLVVQHTKHVYLERLCPCGHWSRALPGRCDDEAAWTVKLSEWHLAGPTLVAFICALTQRMRLSRAKVREFLSDWLGLSLSTALINQCVHEAARALEPVVEHEILETVRTVELLYADETSWKEHGKLLWLWVFTCASATLFIVGRRTREMVQRVLGEGFGNWLMSDGYWAYRELDQRLRCLPHIIRKARALEEGFAAQGRELCSMSSPPSCKPSTTPAAYPHRADCAHLMHRNSTGCSSTACACRIARTRSPGHWLANCSMTGTPSEWCLTIPSCR